MPRFPLLATLVLTAAAWTCGCDRSNAEVEREQQLARSEESQKAKATELAEKERVLAEREATLQKAEADRLRRELDLAQRAREPDHEAPVGQVAQDREAPQANKDSPRLITVTVQLRINMTRPDGKSWDMGGGAPDPEITLQASNGASSKQALSDTLTPTASFKVKLAVGDAVTIAAVDKDALNASDPIGSFSTTYAGRPTTHSGEMGAAKITIRFSE